MEMRFIAVVDNSREFDALLELFPHLYVTRRTGREMVIEGADKMPVYVSVERHPHMADSIICTGRLPGVPMRVYGHGEWVFAVDV